MLLLSLSATSHLATVLGTLFTEEQVFNTIHHRCDPDSSSTKLSVMFENLWRLFRPQALRPQKCHGYGLGTWLSAMPSTTKS
ncbi:hypothetical protein BDW66DRAFT_146555, partial [Aspergillus desertorum]